MDHLVTFAQPKQKHGATFLLFPWLPNTSTTHVAYININHHHHHQTLPPLLPPSSASFCQCHSVNAHCYSHIRIAVKRRKPRPK